MKRLAHEVVNTVFPRVHFAQGGVHKAVFLKARAWSILGRSFCVKDRRAFQKRIAF